MEKALSLLWSMFTNNEMYSNTETAVILALSLIMTILFMWYQFYQADNEHRAHIIADLGFNGYLRHKAEMAKLGYRVP